MIIRSTNLEFYRARVAEARADAEAATLDHVRERCQRSEAAWQALAHKAERAERMRAAEAKRKEEKDGGEASPTPA
jgi:hypothetical protein